MYGNNYGYYNPTRSNIGMPNQPINNQYMQQPTQMPMNNYVQQPTYTPVPFSQSQQNGLLGKIVDDISVVKATEIPLDGSTSFFPLADGSSIITKKLGNNGSSEIVVYKPVIEEETKDKEQDKPKYVTESYFSENIKRLDNSDVLNDLLEEIKDLKQEIKDIKSNKSKEKEK